MIKRCAIDHVCSVKVEVQEALPRRQVGVMRVSYIVGIKGENTPVAELEALANSEKVKRRAQALVDAIREEVEQLFETGKSSRGAVHGSISVD